MSSNLSVVDIFTHPMLNQLASLVHEKVPRRSVRLGTSSPESGFYTPTSPPSSASIGRVESEVLAIWKSVLNVDDSPSTSVNFFDAGGNSLTLAHLHRGMRKKWPNANINLVDLFSHSTIQSQAKVVMASNQSEVATATAPKPSIESSAAICTDIAVVGVAGRFPGASNPDDFYQLLLDRKEATSFFRDVPADSMIFPGGKYVPVRGSLLDVQHFDSASWGIKEEEAMDIDPQQRLFMTVAKEALQDANCSPASSNNIGTYVGAASGTWHSTREPGYGDDFHRAHHEVLTPSISARTAYHLNLQGPNVTLNTACSSGMVAMSLAIDHLRSNKCEVAVAGGVSITFPQAGYVTAERQIFSYSGHCRPFDHRADGTVPADAVCALVLRRLDDAVAAGDEIYSVISGIATGSDGNVGKAGPTVPSPRGQAETIRRAWEDAGIPANTLVYAELHGSGTPIGDALELEGMNLARTELGVGKIGYTAGSNKGNIGNCEAASGLVSVIKLCKSIQHGFVPPLQSFEAINPLINSGLPVKIAAEGVPLSPEAVVSVSSTGLGGVNAHCVMRFPPITRTRRPERATIPAAAPSVVSIVVPPVPAQVTPTGGKILTTIMELASDILDIRIEETSNLRDAGLDSRAQIMLMHKLHETFPGCHISISVIMDPSCTPSSLASGIRQNPRAVPNSEMSLPAYLTVIQLGDSDDVHVFLAPGSGSCASYLALAKHLPDTTIVAFDHPNLYAPQSTALEYSVSRLAETYADDLRSLLSPNKQYTLIGASFGGLVAVAMLTQAGIRIRSVNLLDSPWPALDDRTILTIPSFIRNVFGASGRPTLCASPTTDRTFDSTLLDAYLPTLTEAMLASLAAAPLTEKEDIESTDWKALLGVYIQNVQAMRSFVPESRPCKIPVLYVVAAEGSGRDAEMWKEYFPQLVVKQVSGEHAHIYTGENAPIVATLIKERL